MSINSEYSAFKLEEQVEGSKSFFSNYPASKWSYLEYFNATHNELNKWKNQNLIALHYKNDLDWINDLNTVPSEVKKYVSELKAKKMPTKQELKSHCARPSKKRKVINNYSIHVQGNQNSIGDHNTVTFNVEAKPTETRKGKEKESDSEGSKVYENEEGKKKSIRTTLWEKWSDFTEKNRENFHPYSPESHGIIRCGKGISARPNLDEELYKEHLNYHPETVFALPTISVDYINSVIDSDDLKSYKQAIRKIPEVEEKDQSTIDFLEDILRACYAFHTTNVNVKDGEAVFDQLFIYPFLTAVVRAVGADAVECKADFRPGETELVSMTKQLKTLEAYKGDIPTYLADGIVKLYGIKSIELLLLETSWEFGNKDRSKQSYDHHKGLFGAVAMLKTIADEYTFGNLTTFSRLKVFFLHAADKSLSLWSIRYEKDSGVYELWLEDKLTIKPELEDKLEALPAYINFFWKMKCLLLESVETIKVLREEHSQTLRRNRFTSGQTFPSLTEFVTPSILKLSEKEDKSGMAVLGPFYANPPSSY